MTKLPLFVSTLPVRDVKRGVQPATDPHVVMLQHAISYELSRYWAEVEWSTETSKLWIDVDLVSVSDSGPLSETKPLMEMRAIMRDLLNRLRDRGESLDNRVIVLVVRNDDTLAVYAAFASFLQRNLAPLQTLMVIGVSWNNTFWHVVEMIPRPNEISWKETSIQ